MKPNWMLDNDTPLGFPIITRRTQTIFVLTGLFLLLDLAAVAILLVDLGRKLVPKTG